MEWNVCCEVEGMFVVVEVFWNSVKGFVDCVIIGLNNYVQIFELVECGWVWVGVFFFVLNE